MIINSKLIEQKNYYFRRLGESPRRYRFTLKEEGKLLLKAIIFDQDSIYQYLTENDV